MFGNSATRWPGDPPGSPFAPPRAGADDAKALNPSAPDAWSTPSSEPTGQPAPLRVTRSGLFLFARLWRIVRNVWNTLGCLMGIGILAFFVGLFTDGAGAVLAIPVALFFLAWCAFEIFFTLVCHIEVSEQAIRGHGRMQTKRVREHTTDGVLCYNKITTSFRTVESGDFVFKKEGYQELRPGDVVRLRLYRWAPSGRIRDYDVLGFDVY